MIIGGIAPALGTAVIFDEASIQNGVDPIVGIGSHYSRKIDRNFALLLVLFHSYSCGEKHEDAERDIILYPPFV